jgi:mitochondrial intermediate peptidase
VELETEFVSAITSPPSMEHVFSLGPLNDDTHASLVSWLEQQGLSQTQASNSYDENMPMIRGYLKMPADKRLVSPLLSQFQDEKLRELMWREVAVSPRANINTLGSLILTRQKLAINLGYKSFAHKNLARKVLTTPDDVSKMLNSLAVKSRPQAAKEIELLRELKKRVSENSSDSGIVSDASVIYPWDVNFLATLHGSLSESQSGSNRIASASRELREYMSIDTCMLGLRDVIHQAFGIEVCEEEVLEKEHWMGPDGVLENGQKMVRKYALYGPSSSGRGEPLGHIYLDPFARGHKFAGASHFTIRCGKKELMLDTSDDDEEGSCAFKQANSNTDNDNHQLPIVALLFDFTPPSANSDIPLLTLSQLETLYHEWGHALHSLLSRTSFQHLSGTRGSTDFVEVPSHIFEYFARSPEVIASWAKHRSSGASPSVGLIADALHAQEQFKAIELQTQILYAMADQV